MNDAWTAEDWANFGANCVLKRDGESAYMAACTLQTPQGEVTLQVSADLKLIGAAVSDLLKRTQGAAAAGQTCTPHRHRIVHADGTTEWTEYDCYYLTTDNVDAAVQAAKNAGVAVDLSTITDAVVRARLVSSLANAAAGYLRGAPLPRAASAGGLSKANMQTALTAALMISRRGKPETMRQVLARVCGWNRGVGTDLEPEPGRSVQDVARDTYKATKHFLSTICAKRQKANQRGAAAGAAQVAYQFLAGSAGGMWAPDLYRYYVVGSGNPSPAPMDAVGADEVYAPGFGPPLVAEEEFDVEGIYSPGPLDVTPQFEVGRGFRSTYKWGLH